MITYHHRLLMTHTALKNSAVNVSLIYIHVRFAFITDSFFTVTKPIDVRLLCLQEII